MPRWGDALLDQLAGDEGAVLVAEVLAAVGVAPEQIGVIAEGDIVDHAVGKHLEGFFAAAEVKINGVKAAGELIKVGRALRMLPICSSPSTSWKTASRRVIPPSTRHS